MSAPIAISKTAVNLLDLLQASAPAGEILLIDEPGQRYGVIITNPHSPAGRTYVHSANARTVWELYDEELILWAPHEPAQDIPAFSNRTIWHDRWKRLRGRPVVLTTRGRTIIP
ncbi:hypothetical protein [Jiangella muralis]|uniref:hypothetical protein n=1 Tax=Jiangella muralis TaxID=702383 RepID=UPI00069D6C29|nr:hypothetical protein [Jiangella muralis]